MTQTHGASCGVSRKRAKQRRSIMGDSDKEGEYEVDDLREGFRSSRGSRFNLIANQFGFGFGFRRNFSGHL
ncbi:hypothetical protein CISIN_1g043476mg [Citrus sinensis]|uniref:Uncharacterized protein n=1 Tax=Citrus sinensis TaxID=2711 RepID=A0A067DF30_CITSI|nr:hypothetical protein CISIN_1g043476mg [Citrus sinensis]